MKKFHIYTKEPGCNFPMIMHIEATKWELCEGLLVFRGEANFIKMAIPLENVAYFMEAEA